MSTTIQVTAEDLFQNHPPYRCELVRGEVRTLSLAGARHGMVVMKIAIPLGSFINESGLGCIFAAETGFVIERDPDTVRAPDIAFVRTDRMGDGPTKKFFDGPPDLSVEVLSPDDSASSVNEKAEQWLRSGCHAVWLVDPERQTAAICELVANTFVTRSVVELEAPNMLPGFRMPVADIFA